VVAECKNIKDPLTAEAVRGFIVKLDRLESELDKLTLEILGESKKVDKLRAVIFCKSKLSSGALKEIEDYFGKFGLEAIYGEKLTGWLTENLGKRVID